MNAKMTSSTGMTDLPDAALEQVAAYFQSLSEPRRLQILNTLREGERSVGDIAERLDCSLANVSRHLSHLAQQGLVTRTGRGASVFYAISDPTIYDLCDLVCGNIGRRMSQQQQDRAAFFGKA
jgi:DNA-binding transcriptional ArsR family regulator